MALSEEQQKIVDTGSDDDFINNFGQMVQDSAEVPAETGTPPEVVGVVPVEEPPAPAPVVVPVETVTPDPAVVPTEEVVVDPVELEKQKAAAPDNNELPATTDTPPAQEADYKGFYTEVMSPFKAGGKTIQLQSPQEAMDLIRKGVDYTRKTQELAGDRKLVAMLEKHQLKDEAKLSFLIDLSNKNPEAIRKLVTESGIDPLDIDTSAPSTYAQSNHSVSDVEFNFKEVLTEVNSVPEGKELSDRIFSGWDQASQGHMWTEPAAMQVLLKQKQSGIFDLVDAEVDRRMLLGQIQAGVSRLEAYQRVGLEMGQRGDFNNLPGFQKANPATAQNVVVPPTPIASRAATPKPQVVSDPRVLAASVTTPKTGGSSAAPTIDDFAKLDDASFLAMFKK